MEMWSLAPSHSFSYRFVIFNKPHLCHGNSSSLGEGVVVKVEDSELWVVPHGKSQCHHTGVVDAILGHMDLLQAANHLKNREEFKSLYLS